MKVSLVAKTRRWGNKGRTWLRCSWSRSLPGESDTPPGKREEGENDVEPVVRLREGEEER